MARLLAAGLLTLGLVGTTVADTLVYRPTNPNFGGNPLNGSYLLGNAQAQNDKKDPDASSRGVRSDLDRFTSSLQSRLLSQLLTDLGEGNSGSLETDDFSVNIIDDELGGLLVQITDLNTNETTEINVNGLVPN